MQTASSWVWTGVAISYDDNHYTTSVNATRWVSEWECVYVCVSGVHQYYEAI